MTPLQLATLVRHKTKTNSTTFTDADMLVLANLGKDEIAGKIADKRQEAFNVEEYSDLALDTRTVPFKSATMNSLIRVEFKFTSTGDYVLGNPTKLSHEQIPTQESIIVNYYNNDNPEYFVRDKWIYILSGAIVAVTNGVKWIYKKFPTDLANLTEATTDMSAAASATSLGFPKEFHELLADWISIQYKDRNTIALTKKENDFDNRLISKIDEFSVVNVDEQVLGGIPASEKQGDHGDYGFNL